MISTKLEKCVNLAYSYKFPSLTNLIRSGKLEFKIPFIKEEEDLYQSCLLVLQVVHQRPKIFYANREEVAALAPSRTRELEPLRELCAVMRNRTLSVSLHVAASKIQNFPFSSTIYDYMTSSHGWRHMYIPQ